MEGHVDTLISDRSGPVQGAPGSCITSPRSALIGQSPYRRLKESLAAITLILMLAGTAASANQVDSIFKYETIEGVSGAHRHEQAASSNHSYQLVANLDLPGAGGAITPEPKPDQPAKLPCLKDLEAVLFECFVLILLGYLSCRFKLITSQAKDIKVYLGTFALPALIFLNIAQMKFETINVSFLISILIAKLLIFGMVSILTLTISYPRNFGYAGALSIMATQSNNFALGYPLVKSLYGESKQEMIDYLTLIAPIQSLIVNPLCIMMLEYQKVKDRIGEQSDNSLDSPPEPQQRAPLSPVTGAQSQPLHVGGDLKNLHEANAETVGQSGAPTSRPTSLAGSVDLTFLVSVAKNPLILASAVGLLVNLTYGPELPRFVSRVASTLSASFAAPALFAVGLAMYGKFDLLVRNPGDSMLSTALMVTKGLILPSIMRTLTLIILPTYTSASELPYLVDFSFLFGLFPTAPAACIIANQYDYLSNVISISMLLSTIMSAPLMLAAAYIINPSAGVHPDDIAILASRTVKVAGLLTLLASVLTLYALWRTRATTNFVNIIDVTCGRIKRLKVPSATRLFPPLLALSQTLIGLGVVLRIILDDLNLFESNQSALVGPASCKLDTEDDSQANDHSLGYEVIITVQYILSSSGLALSRFVVLAIVVTIAARNAKGMQTATRVSSALTRIYLLLAAACIVCFCLESDHLQSLPEGPSLPQDRRSLFTRSVYSVIVLIISVPSYALMVKSQNKKSEAQVEESGPGDGTKRSHTMVAGTIRESSISDIECSAGCVATESESSSANVGGNNRQPSSLVYFRPNSGNSEPVASSTNASSSRTLMASELRRESIVVCNAGFSGGHQNELDESPSAGEVPVHYANLLQTAEFNKSSVLMVFMLVSCILNLSATAEKLLYQPFGTFGQIQVISLALEFGQGLVTFFVYGTKGLFAS